MNSNLFNDILRIHTVCCTVQQSTYRICGSGRDIWWRYCVFILPVDIVTGIRRYIYFSTPHIIPHNIFIFLWRILYTRICRYHYSGLWLRCAHPSIQAQKQGAAQPPLAHRSCLGKNPRKWYSISWLNNETAGGTVKSWLGFNKENPSSRLWLSYIGYRAGTTTRRHSRLHHLRIRLLYWSF